MSRPALASFTLLALLSLARANTNFVLPIEWQEAPSGPLGVKEDNNAEAQLLYQIYGNSSMLGYYMASIPIGNPPQRFQLLIDTGSGLTHFPTKGCGDRCTLGAPEDFGFDPEASDTAKNVPCGDDCSCMYCQCTKEGVCSYDLRYGNAGSIGKLYTDIFHLSDEPSVKVNMSFGLETEELGSLQTNQVNGMMGMSMDPNSFINQLADQGVVDRSFAMCWQSKLDGGTGSSFLLFGQPPANEDLKSAARDPSNQKELLQYSDMVMKGDHYYVKLDDIAVDGEPLDAVSLLDPDIASANDVLIDSGTTFTTLPPKVFAKMKEKMTDYLKDKDVEVVSNEDMKTCWKSPDFTDLFDTVTLGGYFPTISYAFEGGANFESGPETYLWRPAGTDETTVCWSVFPSSSRGFIVGNTIRQRVVSHYDIGNQRMGFMSVSDCSALADVWLSAGTVGGKSETARPGTTISNTNGGSGNGSDAESSGDAGSSSDSTDVEC